MRVTCDQEISYYDFGPDKRNKLGGWVDSDFASDIDSRKSMTGYLMSLNGGPISWKSSRQDGVTLISNEVEFVETNQTSQEVRTLFRGFGYTQKGPTEIWEDNASCIMMSETNLLKYAISQNVFDTLTKPFPGHHLRNTKSLW